MQKWEYLSTVVKDWPAAGQNQMSIQTPLNNRGNSGWELVSVTPHSTMGQFILVFKRPKQK